MTSMTPCIGDGIFFFFFSEYTIPNAYRPTCLAFFNGIRGISVEESTSTLIWLRGAANMLLVGLERFQRARECTSHAQ